ncbi:MAG: tetratricopeptide repeat protein [Planctomycetota bacterium]
MRQGPAQAARPRQSGAGLRHADIHPLDRAIAELRSELARSPDDPTLLGRIAALYYRRGDLGQAEKHYQRAIALSPHRPTLYNNMGNVLCDMGRMRDGIAAYEHAIALEQAAGRDPSPEAVVNLELARIENRLVHERIEYLKRAVELEVSSAEAQNTLGCAYLLRGLHTEALEAFRQAAEMDARNTAAGINIAFTYALNLSAGAELKDALAELAETVLRFPNESRLHIHHGELLENAGLLEGAEGRYLHAVQVNPRCLEAYDLLGRLREATGLLGTCDEIASAAEQALGRLEAAARQERTAASTGARAQALFDLALVEVARARLARRPVAGLVAVDALLREALVTAAPLKDGGGEVRRAVVAQAACLRASLLEAEGRRNEARLVLEQASQTHPENARLWLERGSLALRNGDIDEAVAYFDHATLAAPQDAAAYHSLRFAFEAYRRYRAERVRFETAVAANPRDAVAHHHLALAALAALKNEEALFHFTRAMEMDPRLSDASCGRGRALQRLGHLEEAEAAYVHALEVDPGNSEAQRSLVALRSQKLLVPLPVPAQKPK